MTLALAVPAKAAGASRQSEGILADLPTNEFFRRLMRMHIGGSVSLNWRNVGPRTPGFETQIQNEVYLADMFFGLDGPFVDGAPVQMEWHMPTGSRGELQLNQLNFKFTRIDGLMMQFGKFIVPFGRYNELYRPDQYLAVTRPLIHASPDGLDLVVRPNSPRPPVSIGYTDIGARITYYPAGHQVFIPEELTFFVVNGLGESTGRSRTFPDPENLGIPAPPTNGVTYDFGHGNNNLADDNNNKAFGGRAVFTLGDIPLAWPIPEGALDMKAVSLGFSLMGGQYDLENRMNYTMGAVDYNFEYFGFNFSGQYVYSENHFLVPLKSAANPLTNTAAANQDRNKEILQGYFIQTSFPVAKKPWWGDRITGLLVFNQAFRRGPQLDLQLNFTDVNGTTFPSLLTYDPAAPYITRRIDKYTAAMNWQLTDHFFFKFDYSYWVMGRSTNRSINSKGLVDIYQGAMSMVMAF